MTRVFGILRELTNSPNRETDDALILKAVLEQLGHLGFSTRLLTPEEFDAADFEGCDAALPMCESYPRLARLKSLAARFPALCMNPAESVLNCYRVNMVNLLGDRDDVSFPASELRLVAEGAGTPPRAFPAPQGWWIKRGDVHNTCDRDVVRLDRWDGLPAVLADFSAREITHYVVQPHLDGNLVKFYGVGPGRWFTWFFHDPTRARRIPFDLETLARAAAAGAAALGLEVFGGDAIVAPDGSVTVIDLNSWPSFARVRAEAAVQISWHIQHRLLRQTRSRK